MKKRGSEKEYGRNERGDLIFVCIFLTLEKNKLVR